MQVHIERLLNKRIYHEILMAADEGGTTLKRLILYPLPERRRCENAAEKVYLPDKRQRNDATSSYYIKDLRRRKK